MDYPTRIETRKQRTIYYTKNSKRNKPPKEYLDEEDIYTWKKRNGKLTLYDMARQEFVVKQQAPKFISIGTNQLHSANIDASRGKVSQMKQAFVAKVKETLKDFYKQYVKKLEIKKFPIGVRFTFLGNPNDLDNHDIYYRKVFLDSIQETEFIGVGKKGVNPDGSIPNDDIKHIAVLQSQGINSKYNALIIELFEINITEIKEAYENYVEANLSDT